MNTKHTPLPWSYRKASQHFYIEANAIGYGKAIAEVKYVGNATTGWTSEANAEFIARACNSHYELLEALKALLAADRMECKPGTDEELLKIGRQVNAENLAEIAIKKAQATHE